MRCWSQKPRKASSYTSPNASEGIDTGPRCGKVSRPCHCKSMEGVRCRYSKFQQKVIKRYYETAIRLPYSALRSWSRLYLSTGKSVKTLG